MLKRISISLPSETLNDIKKNYKKYDFKSESDLVRAAITDYLKRREKEIRDEKLRKFYIKNRDFLKAECEIWSAASYVDDE
ncbi:MAG: ribbon-helix-helix protein, CopG family [Bacteroidota bacterium]|nr:ribbon-helix-helix protein, CopG family [Bacteroidota bacterium]